MTSRLFPAGYLNNVSPNVTCAECGKSLPAGLPHCPICEKHHDPAQKHKGTCSTPGCYEPALLYNGHASLLCRLHSIERVSAELAAELHQPESLEKPVPPQLPNPKAVRRFMVRSRSRPTQEHMVELLEDSLHCSCEAGVMNHACRHKTDVEAVIYAGIREVSV